MQHQPPLPLPAARTLPSQFLGSYLHIFRPPLQTEVGSGMLCSTQRKDGAGVGGYLSGFCLPWLLEGTASLLQVSV